MPFNGSGVYSLPEAPFVTGSVIAAAPVNNDLDDIGDALTTVCQGGVIANSIARAKLTDGVALSVIGRSANSTGAVADIQVTASSGGVLRESGSVLGFGTIATAGIADDAVTYAKIQNVSATDRLLGRDTAGAGNVEELTVSGGIEFTGSGGIQATAASDTVAGKIEIATQAEMETASSTTLAVTPGRTQYHPGVAKAWFHYNEVVPAIGASYGVSSISDDGGGIFTVNFSTAFTSVNYAAVFGGTGTSGAWFVKISTATPPTASACVVNVFGATFTAADGERIMGAFFGDQ